MGTQSGGLRTPPAPLAFRDWLVGKTITNINNTEQRYHVLDLTGAGGNARIYKAQDLANDKRVVSLKFAPPMEEIIRSEGKTRAGDTKKRLYERFVREAETLARLSHPSRQHPNIVTVYGGGGIRVEGHDEALPYMVMEHIEGLSLAQLIEQAIAQGKPISWSVAQDITLQVCAALNVVHHDKIYDRDVKPDNIMLKLDGDRYRVKLIDFGSVMLSNVNTITMDTTVGTLQYMSPEQLNRSHEVGAPSDLYSLSCTLYQMLTGSVPFPQEELPTLMTAITVTPPESPRKRVPDRGIPRDVCRTILKALEKKPDDRYKDAWAFAAAISSCTWNDKGPHKRLHPVLWFEKHPRIRLLSIGAAGLIVAGGTFDVYHHFKVRHDTAVMESQQHAASVARPPLASTTTTPLLNNLPAAPGESTRAPLASQPVPRPESTVVTPAASTPPAKAPPSNIHKIKKTTKTLKKPPQPKKDTLGASAKPDNGPFHPYLRYRTPAPDSPGRK